MIKSGKNLKSASFLLQAMRRREGRSSGTCFRPGVFHVRIFPMHWRASQSGCTAFVVNRFVDGYVVKACSASRSTMSSNKFLWLTDLAAGRNQTFAFQCGFYVICPRLRALPSPARQ